jgi:hypothetical protein
MSDRFLYKFRQFANTAKANNPVGLFAFASLEIPFANFAGHMIERCIHTASIGDPSRY